MKAFFKNLLSSISPPKERPFNEEERLLEEIETTREKMEYARNHFNYADPEYVDIAVLELLIVETQYAILNKRYRLMRGLKDETPYFIPSATKTLSTLEINYQNHALYKSLIKKSTPDTLPSTPVTPQ